MSRCWHRDGCKCSLQLLCDLQVSVCVCVFFELRDVKTQNLILLLLPPFPNTNSHPEYQKLNAPDEANAGGDPGKMSDAQVKAYLEAHPEVAAAAMGSSKGSSPNSFAATGAAANTGSASGGADWVQQAQADKSAKKSSWWGGGAGGGKKSASDAPASSDSYVPPVPVAAPVSASAATAPMSLPGAAGDQGQFGIDDENPFKQ